MRARSAAGVPMRTNTPGISRRISTGTSGSKSASRIVPTMAIAHAAERLRRIGGQRGVAEPVEHIAHVARAS